VQVDPENMVCGFGDNYDKIIWKEAQDHAQRQYRRAYRKQWRKRKRDVNPCKYCHQPIPFPSPGRQYHVECAKEIIKTRQNKKARKLHQSFRQFKCEQGCAVCGYNKYGGALDYHHINPHEKEKRISAELWVSGKGLQEIAKCVLLCKNCHYEQHAKKHRLGE
jgi:hypothetical protein